MIADKYLELCTTPRYWLQTNHLWDESLSPMTDCTERAEPALAAYTTCMYHQLHFLVTCEQSVTLVLEGNAVAHLVRARLLH